MAAKKSEPAPDEVVAVKEKCPVCEAPNVMLKDVGGGIKVCEKCAAKRFSSKVRKSIQEAFDRRQEQAQRDSWVKRITIAKLGMDHYDKKKFPEALHAFREYIRILETRYGCGPNGLRQSIFDPKTEGNEILFLAGIYWDIAKIYDRMKDRETDMRNALAKYVEFAVGKPHLILASEAMRKYIKTEKCHHKEDFNRTHRILRSHLSTCFIATAVFEARSPEVRTLRRFRDHQLLSNTPGRLLVKAYYRLSPPLALRLAGAPRAAAAVRMALRGLTRLLEKLT